MTKQRRHCALLSIATMLLWTLFPSSTFGNTTDAILKLFKEVTELKKRAHEQDTLIAKLKKEVEKQSNDIKDLRGRKQTLGNQTHIPKEGWVVKGPLVQESDASARPFVTHRNVLTFVGEPSGDYNKDVHGAYYYHIKTPLRVESSHMYRYDLVCYAYGAARPFSATYVGYLYAGWRVNPIYNGHTRMSNTPPDRGLRTSQYVSKDGWLHLKFGAINRYILQCVLHYQSSYYLGSAADLHKTHASKNYQVFTRKDNRNDMLCRAANQSACIQESAHPFFHEIPAARAK